ncbi:MAG: hypothetical protein HRU77_06435 [Gammaproteobacteria bacterium]|nr:MAG: hypothetical protein HRU77_06435 [Gammaproteobacteria bacterium]
MLNALKVPRWIYSGGVPVGLTDPDTGLAVPQTNSVADWAALQAIPKSSVNDGLCIFVTAYKAWFVYMHAVGRWVTNRAVIYSQVFGTDAAPTCSLGTASLSASTPFPHGTINIPQYMLNQNSVIRIMGQIKKHGTTGSLSPNLYLGTTNNVVSSDPSAWAGSFANTDGHTLDFCPIITFGSKTSYRTSYANPDNQGSSTNGGLLEKTSNINTDALGGMYVNVALPAKSAGDSYDLLFLMVEIVRN